MTEDRLLEVLDEALATRVIEELPSSVGRYQFTHALIQETLVGELSLTRRARLHARIAETLEELYGTDGEAHAAELAHHFAEAQNLTGPEKVVRYSLLAGERALVAYAHEEALSHFERALSAKNVPSSGPDLATDAETAALLFGLGRAQAVLQRDEAFTSLVRAFDYYVEAGDVNRVVDIAVYPDYGTGVRREDGVAQLIARALAQVPPQSHEAGRLLSRHGQVVGLQEGNYQEARDAFDRALAIARRDGDTALEMQTLAAAASVASNHVRYDECLEHSLQAIELSRRVDDPRSEVTARYFAVTCFTINGDLDGARRHVSPMLASAERLRDRFWLAGALWKNEIVYRLAGDWETARGLSDRGLLIASVPGLLLTDQIMLEFEVGNFHEGEAYLEERPR